MGRYDPAAAVPAVAVGLLLASRWADRRAEAEDAVAQLVAEAARFDESREAATNFGSVAHIALDVPGAEGALATAYGPDAVRHAEAVAEAWASYSSVVSDDDAVRARELRRRLDDARRRVDDHERALGRLTRTVLTVLGRVGDGAGTSTAYEAREVGTGPLDRVVLLGSPQDVDPLVGRGEVVFVEPAGDRSIGGRTYPVARFRGTADDMVRLDREVRAGLRDAERAQAEIEREVEGR